LIAPEPRPHPIGDDDEDTDAGMGEPITCVMDGAVVTGSVEFHQILNPSVLVSLRTRVTKAIRQSLREPP
jgi:hypothetical protein